MFALWVFVSFPLSVLGTIFGRHVVRNTDTPCRVNTIPRWDCSVLHLLRYVSCISILVLLCSYINIWSFCLVILSTHSTLLCVHSLHFPPLNSYPPPRPIPSSPWYLSPSFIIPVSGILPFGSIFIEMYFVFTAFWSYKFYYVYGFMLLVYGILAMVTICTSIVSVYFILNSENYHWQWMSFACAGSTAGYVFLYSTYYFLTKTQMTGMLQVSFYFGYM